MNEVMQKYKEVKFDYAVLHVVEGFDLSYLKTDEALRRKVISQIQERKNYDYYLSKKLGPLQVEFVFDIFKDVFFGKQTFTEWCLKNEIPRSVIRWFRQHSKEFVQFMDSVGYRHRVGQTIRSNKSFAKEVNKRKSTMIRVIDRSSKSYKRALNLCQIYRVTPLFTEDTWKGSHLSDGTIPYYQVRCIDCGIVYDTYFHTSTIRVCPKCHDAKFASIREARIAHFIENKGYSVWRNDSTLIKSYQGYPSELDIYVPELKIAFECNGYYFHNINVHPKDYHINKTLACKQNGIRLYHIWESESDSSVFRFVDRVLKNPLWFPEDFKDRDNIPVDKCPWLSDVKTDDKFEYKSPTPVFWCYKANDIYKIRTLLRHSPDCVKECFVECYDSGSWVRVK